MALGGLVSTGLAKLGGFVAANKVVAVVATGAVVAAGGTTAVALRDDAPPAPQIQALEQAEDEPEAVPSQMPEPAESSKPTEAPKPEPEPTEKPEPTEAPKPTEIPEPDVKVEEKVEEKVEKPAQDDKNDDEKEHDEKKHEKKHDEEKTAGVDISLRLTGDRDAHTVHVSNLGTSTSGRVKIKYIAPDGVRASIKMLGHTGPVQECDSWYCYFDGLPVGSDVASITWKVEVDSCAKGGQGGTIYAHLDGDTNDRNNSVFKQWCRDTDVASSDLSISVSGGLDATLVKVHNAGPDTAGKVKVKYHSVEGADGTIEVVSTTGNVTHCDGWYCYFENLPVGENVASVTFKATPRECYKADGRATIEVYYEADPNDGNDRHTVRWCDGFEKPEPTEKPAVADLAVTIDGSVDNHKVKVTNVGDETATNVVLSYGVHNGTATVVFTEGNDASCTAEGCHVAALGPGESLWIRVSATVDCTGQDDVWGKGRVTSDADANDDNDWAALDYGC